MKKQIILIVVCLILILQTALLGCSSSSSSPSGKKNPTYKSKSYISTYSSKAEDTSIYKDKVLVDEPEKTMYQVYAYSSSIHFKGSYSGSSNFIIWVLDSNQNRYELVANEIGSYFVDKRVPVTEGAMYYILIECAEGSWEMQWTGTYGN